MTRPPPPDVVARLRELIAADAERGGVGACPGVWRVRTTEGQLGYGIDERGDVFVIDRDRAPPSPAPETELRELTATYHEAVRLHPELAPLLARASRRYLAVENGMFYEQYQLVLSGDGTCELGVSFSDPAGSAGGWNAVGRWTQRGGRIDLVFDQRDEGAPRTAQATISDAKHVEVDGIGRFWLSERD